MKGVILAAGKGKRLYPLTKAIPKVLLPMYDRPMIYFALDFMNKAKIDDVVIVIREEDRNIFEAALGDGAGFGLRISYRVQKEAKGTASAVREVRDFINGEDVILYYGDNVIIGDDFDSIIQDGMNSIKENSAALFALEVANPSDYGVLEIGSDDKIISLEEKPLKPKSNFIAPGIYFYPKDLTSKLDKVELSPRGEYEMSDVNVSYLDEERLIAIKLPREVLWYDAGNFDTLLEAGTVIRDYVKNKSL